MFFVDKPSGQIGGDFPLKISSMCTFPITLPSPIILSVYLLAVVL